MLLLIRYDMSGADLNLRISVMETFHVGLGVEAR